MRVLVISGSRADYGLLTGPMRAIAAEPGMELRLALTGVHREDGIDSVRKAAVADGFRVDAEIPLDMVDDSPLSVARATGQATEEFARVIVESDADLVLLLGDRYEIFAAATAAALVGVPIAHLHGGEATTGAIDDVLRNAITKLSSIHLTAAEAYRRRIIQMGEVPERVYTVGAPGVECALNTERAPLDELWHHIGQKLPQPFLLVTYHPETAGMPDPTRDIGELLSALDDTATPGILFTGVNSDAHRDQVVSAIEQFVEDRSERSALVGNLGQRLYWTAMANCAAVVGNSSSGIIEAPALRVPTVNVGTRQGGRLRAPSVIDCNPNKSDIAEALSRAVGGDVALKGDTPYGMGNVSVRIVRTLVDIDMTKLLPKKFYDIPASQWSMS